VSFGGYGLGRTFSYPSVEQSPEEKHDWHRLGLRLAD
jgi:hypothetical protein